MMSFLLLFLLSFCLCVVVDSSPLHDGNGTALYCDHTPFVPLHARTFDPLIKNRVWGKKPTRVPTIHSLTDPPTTISPTTQPTVPTTLPPTITINTQAPTTVTPSPTTLPPTTISPTIPTFPVTTSPPTIPITTNPPTVPITTNPPTTTQPPTIPITTSPPTTTQPPTIPITTNPPTTQAPWPFPTIPPPTTATTQPVVYHGGVVIRNTPTVYYVFYGNWSTMDPQGMSLIEEWTGALSQSYTYNILSTYNDSVVSSLPRTIIYGGSTVDSSYSFGKTLTDSSIYYVIKKAITDGKLPSNSVDPLNSVYLVLTSSDVDQSNHCVTQCGWHTSGGMLGQRIRYGFVGSASRCSGCSSPYGSPNSSPNADSMLSVIWHELAEVITDPDFTAWWEGSNYNEVGDVCAWNYGYTWSTNNGALANSRIGNRDYMLQTIWVNLGVQSHCANVLS